MPRDIDEKALFDRFSSKYELINSDLLQQIERSSCGCDYGATSFATREQVNDLGTMLGLEPSKRLLEVGAGAGWPGLYLAKKTGCDVTLTDLPIEGLRIAKQRAASDNITGISRMAVASGSALPFREGWFHAISHSDVLCCLVDKISVLNACREVIHAAGKMVFSDLSAEFLDTLQVKLNNELDHAADLENLLGKEETSIRLTRTRSYINTLEQGLIRRELFHAIPATNA